MKKLILLLSIVTITISCFGQIDKNLSYEELETQAISSFRNNNVDSAIMILEYALKNFPEELASTTTILPQIYTRVGNYTRAIEIWKMGINKGYSYNLNNDVYKKYYKDNVEFERLANIEKTRMDTMHVKFEIVLPTGYNNEETYPILFVFHGNNRNIEKSKISWNAPIMEREFISVFLQSYIPSSPTNFNWVPNDEKIKKEFTEIYNQILKKYPVNESKIIFAGMSAGGKKALDFTLNNYFPVSGLVLNCPVIPESITDEMITGFAKSNKKLGIITGENDFALEGQKKLVSTIDSLEGQTKMFITKDLGHSFAENFTELLDEYLSWVIKSEQNFLESKDAYFGLTPPGLIPEVFAPGVVSDSTWAEHCQVAVSPDGKEIYWSAWSGRYPPADTSMKNSEQIYFSEFKNGTWTKPAIAEFIKDHLNCLNGGPSFSPDGNRLYFYSTGIEGGFGKKDVWYVDRTKTGWSKPINAGEPLNTPDGDWTPSFNPNGYAYHMGNYYYNENEKPLKFKYSQGRFSKPDTVIIHPDFKPVWAFYVSPDESYLIFSGLNKEGFGSLDIYICFKTDDDNWGTPINMGDQINTEKVERFPVVSPDAKYLFFMRHTPGQDFFWVSTDVIEELKNKHQIIEHE